MSYTNHSNNSNDLLNFSKAVATTASAIVSSPNGFGSSEILINNKNYKESLSNTLKNSNSHQLIYKHTDLGQDQQPGSLNYKKKKQKYFVKKRRSKSFDELSDEALMDIPSNSHSTTSNGTGDMFSLFQGFSATLPEINDRIERIREGKLIESNPDQIDESAILPRGITTHKIKISQNSRQLSQFKDSINYKLDLLEIRKGLAANEINEIDEKIRNLQLMRESIFEKVRKFEQDELFLENQLYEIDSRMVLIKDIDPGINFQLIDKDEQEQDELEKDESSNLMTKSVYGKLKSDPKLKNYRNVSASVPHNRKTKPMLQTYYEPGSEIRSFHAHDDVITSLDFDVPFGTMVTSSLDNTVKVWDLSRGKCSGLLEGHFAAVKCLQMEENLVVTGSLDATLKLWDLSKLNVLGGGNDEEEEEEEENLTLLHSFESHVEEVTALHFHKNNLVSGSSDRTIRQWDLNTGHCLQTIDVLWASTQSNITHSQFLDTGNNLSMFKTNNASFIGALQCYDAALATGTADGIVRLWDLRSGEVIRQLIGHTGPMTSLQFDDKQLITGSSDRSIRMWDLRTGGIIDAFAYDSPITSLQFDNRRIICTNQETTMKIYDRIDERHWECGAGKSRKDDTDYEASTINFARHKEGYAVEGRSNGMIGTWAV
ncbi:hypothetical protein PACTADRAFT_39164 [Pachysolen tannophilus NRRL Y-2460]|uniref:Uncharacterized protein n=1 Tax=Pachysolen tannophilus NRRL Y-2460 TaxID=669874 RepID=A0A1E4TZQ9_PACTA|nr:hypothetical protein PACTADRAFT_39164 [Pachysolen tannophilus NRRL Y-2460]